MDGLRQAGTFAIVAFVCAVLFGAPVVETSGVVEMTAWDDWLSVAFAALSAASVLDES